MQIQKKEYGLELETNSRIYIICLIPFKQLNFFSKTQQREKKKKKKKKEKNMIKIACMWVETLKVIIKGIPRRSGMGR